MKIEPVLKIVTDEFLEFDEGVNEESSLFSPSAEVEGSSVPSNDAHQIMTYSQEARNLDPEIVRQLDEEMARALQEQKDAEDAVIPEDVSGSLDRLALNESNDSLDDGYSFSSYNPYGSGGYSEDVDSSYYNSSSHSTSGSSLGSHMAVSDFVEILDAMIVSKKFLERFGLKYGSSRPNFLSGSAKDAIARAQESLNPLLLYLHDPQNHKTDEYCGYEFEVIYCFNASNV